LRKITYFLVFIRQILSVCFDFFPFPFLSLSFLLPPPPSLPPSPPQKL
jgi:hypothetical protein